MRSLGTVEALSLVSNFEFRLLGFVRDFEGGLPETDTLNTRSCMAFTGRGIISSEMIWLPSGREHTPLCASQLISSSEAAAAGEVISLKTNSKP
jgi:hypothetical protein